VQRDYRDMNAGRPTPGRAFRVPSLSGVLAVQLDVVVRRLMTIVLLLTLSGTIALFLLCAQYRNENDWIYNFDEHISFAIPTMVRDE